MANKTTLKKLSQGYGYKYTELSAIHEEMEKQGIYYWQETKWDEGAGADYIWTHLKYDDDGSKWEEPRRGVKVIDTAGGGMNAAQAQGSGVTYARRYSLLMALGWATEDDDAASAGNAPKQNAKPAKPWDKYKAGKPSEKQLSLIKHLLEEGGANEQAIVDYMAKITTSAAASKAIESLKARLSETQDEEPTLMPSDEELAEFGAGL